MSHTHMPCWHCVSPVLEEGGVVLALVARGTIDGHVGREAP